jgi:short subunit dehydrogenase-like uncharacterized protein
MDNTREFDIIIWGASGFTGRLVAQYYFENYGTDGDFKWAIGGRNETKLKAVRAEVADDTVPIVVADSKNAASLEALVKRTKVICTTVGPYAIYGSELVAACIAHQTHYCDLTGEVQWMRRMIDQHHESAIANGVKIVHTCGFDSIPSDMGVYYIQKELKAKNGQIAKNIKMRVAAISGGISGGTYASLSRVKEEAELDNSIYEILGNPYGLNPKGEMQGSDKPDLMHVKFDEASKSWIGPFVMASINTKVVRRSNALSDYTYGKDFGYEESTINGKGFKGKLVGKLTAFVIGLMMDAKPGSFIKKRFDGLLPKPGEGPSKKQRENGFFNLRFYITLADGTKKLAKVTGDRDPGYGSTSKMLGESAICLAKDDLPNTSGMLTPSVAMGDALLTRLEANAGLTFSFES